MHYPNFHHEKTIWKKGYKFIAGVDEVGRGAFAGPVVAGCCVFNKNIKIKQSEVTIKDSKQLNPKMRAISDKWIKKNTLAWGVGKVSSREIDKIGIVKATNKAIRMAIKSANKRLNKPIDYLLIDAFYIPYIKGIKIGKKIKKNNKKKTSKYRPERRYGQQTAIVKGDEKSLSIASASIIAKVYRDNLMIKLSKKGRYKKYGWDKNKGYGTKSHRDAIDKFGATKKHRMTFI